MEVIAREDTSAISLRDLARTIGVRHSALYSHFRDRSELLAVIAGAGFRALLAKLQSAPPPKVDRIAHLATSYVRFARANPAFYHTMFSPDGSLSENANHTKPACEDCFQTLVAALRESDISEKDAHDRATAIWSALHGLVMLGSKSGPLYQRISAKAEIPFATRVARVLAQGEWPKT